MSSLSRRKSDVIIGSGQWQKRLYEQIDLVSRADMPVLIVGESGTGKELVARMVHNGSGRREKRFVAINCAALPATLIESELFGYSQGAFTGAGSDKSGVFEAASQGTLFLDEVGEIPLEVQAKLLRVLEENSVRRLGETHDRPISTRLLTATNRPLEDMIEDGQFRNDLYYRINVFPIELPPLRDRKHDIPLLANHFLEKEGRSQPLAEKALQLLQAHTYPGNVRELENVIKRAVVLAGNGEVAAEHIQFSASAHKAIDFSKPYRELKKQWLAQFERQYLEALMQETAGNVAAAARMADMDRKNLWQIMKRLGISAEDYR